MTDQRLILNEYAKLEQGNITDKQIQFITALYQSVESELLVDSGPITNSPSKISPLTVLNKVGISSLGDLNKLKDTQIFILVEELKKLAPMTIQQSFTIMEQFESDDIKKILKKDINDLTFKDAESLLAGPEKFNPWIKEHPHVSEDEWEFGWQESDKFKDDKMYYLKFYNMMMIDIDTHEDFDKMLNKLKTFNNFKFRIYQTYGGYHIFIISELIKYNHPNMIQLSKVIGGDIYYSLFAHKTGYKVRLNNKIGRVEPHIAKYVCEVGSKPTHPVCKELIKIHDIYVDKRF